MRAKWGRRLAMSTIGLGLAAALAYAFRPQPVPVDFAEVTRGTLTVTVDDEGRTRVREKYVVSAPVAGRVKRIEIDPGDWVVAGETVLTNIQPTEPAFLDLRSETRARAAVKAAEAALALARAEVTRAEAELDFARSEWTRAKSLADRGTISASALDRAALEVRTREAALATAKASLRVRKFELETAKAALITPGDEKVAAAGGGEGCCVPVRAPVSGRVLRVLHQSESVVAAGTPLMVIGDPRDLEVVVELLSTDAVRIAEGAEAVIEGWGGAAPLAGRVRRIEPYGFTKVSALGIEEQRVNVVIDFVDPPERWRPLGHGYRVDVRIVTWRGDDVLKVPTSALFRDRDEWVVFALAKGRAALRRVRIGHANDREAELLEGLDEGALVVLHPSDRIKDGTLIVSRDAG